MFKKKILAGVVTLAMLLTVAASCISANAATDLSIVSATYQAGNQSMDITLSASVDATFDWSKVDLLINSEDNNRTVSLAQLLTADNYGTLANVTNFGAVTSMPSSASGATFNIRPQNGSWQKLFDLLASGNVAHAGASKEGYYLVFNEGWITAEGYEYSTVQAIGIAGNLSSNANCDVYEVPQPTPTVTPTPSNSLTEDGNVKAIYLPSTVESFIVDIDWQSLNFTYQQGSWNGTSFDAGQWVNNTSTITVTNRSNCDIDYDAAFSNDSTTSDTVYGVYATLTGATGSLEDASISGASTSSTIGVEGLGVPAEEKLGQPAFAVDTITVTVSKSV